MTSQRPGQDDLPREDQTTATPEDAAERAATHGPAPAVKSLGLMPLLLGVAAIVVVALLMFSGEPSSNQHPEPRSQTSAPSK
jgi:hypothetical protein